MKRYIPIFFGLAFLAAMSSIAWSERPAGNRVASVQVYVNGSSIIPTYFTRRIPGYVTGSSSVGSSVQSLIMTGLANKGYSHMMVLNNTGASLVLANTDAVSPFVIPTTVPLNAAGNAQSEGRFFILPNNNNAWDDLSIFDALYLRSGSGASVTAVGNIDIMVW